MKLLIASNNSNKIKEFKDILLDYPNIEILSPKDINLKLDVVEDGISFLENSIIKAKAFYNHTNINTIADDSGLIVPDLNNEPGIFSSRYARDNATDRENREKLIIKLKENNLNNPKAKFICVITFFDGKQINNFTGECSGIIINQEKGNKGFGYDPIFIPDGYNKTFAELDSEIKNTISHRAKALNKFKLFFEYYIKFNNGR